MLLKNPLRQHEPWRTLSRSTIWRNTVKSIICYIAGAYLLHTQVLATPMPNLTAIVYDRSPTQERTGCAMERIPKLGSKVDGYSGPARSSGHRSHR